MQYEQELLEWKRGLPTGSEIDRTTNRSIGGI